MTAHYSFLESYICRRYTGERNRLNSNIFYEVSEQEICDAEQRLGFSFPSEIRQFFKEVGVGSLTTPHKPPFARH